MPLLQRANCYDLTYNTIIAPLTPLFAFAAGKLEKRDLVRQLVKNLSDDQLEAFLTLLSDIRVERVKNPLSKFRNDRPEQMAFITSKCRITIALCGNRWGKTLAMMYFLASTGTGQNPDAKHQPDPSRPLRVWVIGESWTVLNDTILKELTGLLRPDQYKLKHVNSFVESMTIFAPNGGRTEIRFIPSGEDEEQKFESAALHYVLIDEGIRAALFRQIIFRIGDTDGQMFQAFTRLPDNMHLADYLVDLENADGEFAPLLKKGYIKLIRGSTYENKYITRQDLDFLETSVANNELLKQARLYGKVTKPQGTVFNFQRTVERTSSNGLVSNKPYGLFSWGEFARIAASREPGRWDLAHDYGQAAPACWLLIWTSLKTGTSYIVDEVYASGMSVEESTAKCNDMLKRWECYYDIKLIVVDDQLTRRGVRGKRIDAEVTLLQQYKDQYDDNGDPYLPRQAKFIARRRDKVNTVYTINLLRELLETENPLTPGLPYIRVSANCKNLMKELTRLRWKKANRNTSTIDRETTEGEDHAIDPLRYFVNNKINHTMWKRRKELRTKTNELKYLAGGSAVPFFEI